MKKIVMIVGILALASACTKAIIVSPEAKNVRMVSAAQKKNCDFVRTISARQPIGPDKKGDALKLALNEAAAAGANAFYVVSTTDEGGIKGTLVVGEALRCK